MSTSELVEGAVGGAVELAPVAAGRGIVRGGPAAAVVAVVQVGAISCREEKRRAPPGGATRASPGRRAPRTWCSLVSCMVALTPGVGGKLVQGLAKTLVTKKR